MVAGATGPAVVRGLPFTPAAVDGACGMRVRADGSVRVELGDDPDVQLRADAGNGRPAADAGPDQRVAAGAQVPLDGTGSCDPDRDALTPSWELVSAPAGSDWSLEGADTWAPSLAADRVGPYRVRLTVTDAHGRASNVSEVLVVAGDRCADGMDDDLDGLLDTDDPDCDAPAEDTARVLLLADQAGYAGHRSRRRAQGLPRPGGRPDALRRHDPPAAPGHRPAGPAADPGRPVGRLLGRGGGRHRPGARCARVRAPVLPGLRPGDRAGPPPGHRRRRHAPSPSSTPSSTGPDEICVASNRGAVLSGHRSCDLDRGDGLALGEGEAEDLAVEPELGLEGARMLSAWRKPCCSPSNAR